MQKRLESQYATQQPARRPLKIFASDPMAGRTAGNRIEIDIENEDLTPGPCGTRVAVVDYDGAHRTYYPPISLNDAAILIQSGLDPAESDPRFHQQMVYAVTMRTIENFDRALGRRLEFRTKRTGRLRLFPHAFHGANAFYSRDLNGVLFGYFRADPDNPGRNLPGQNVFTCLSHDIVVHEVTHAVVDRLRQYFLEPSNEDVLAFHEGFADVIALFQHFTFPELLRAEIQQTSSRLHEAGPLISLAQQFGEASGMGRALRSALGRKDVVLSRHVVEPHARGSILVAAVFDGFFNIYQRRIRDLIRIATGGSGLLPEGDLHPDLVNRIANEAAATAQSVLSMCIRAFDYLPPVDITFGDYLRAMITADYELVQTDTLSQRDSMIEGFRLRGIYAEGVTSLAEESLLWPSAPATTPPIPVNLEPTILSYLVRAATNFGRPSATPRTTEVSGDLEETDEGHEVAGLSKEVAQALHRYATANCDALLLNPALKVQVQGFHSVFRVAPSGQLLIELVAQFMQTDKTRQEEFGGIPLRGGTTVVASADGTIRYIIAKPLPSPTLEPVRQQQAQERIRRQERYLDIADAIDPELSFATPQEYATRALRRADLSRLHFT